MQKKKKRVFIKLTNNKGNNISPCFLPNENVIFCSDFESNQPQIYYLDRKKNATYKLTNGGYCAAPSYCQKINSIVYTRPVNGTFQLFSLNLNDFNKPSPLVRHPVRHSFPAVVAKATIRLPKLYNKQVGFSKLYGGQVEEAASDGGSLDDGVRLRSTNNLQERQLTFGPGDKHEPSFSECGRFIAFSYDYQVSKNLNNHQIAVLNCNSGKIRILTTGKEPKSFPRWGKTFLYL